MTALDYPGLLREAVRANEVGSCSICHGLKAGFGPVLSRDGVHVTTDGHPARCGGYR